MLPFKGVLIQCLDIDRRPIANAFASGFIVLEGDVYYLYTCWHVVTGLNPNIIEVPNCLPNRKYIRISIKDVRQPHPEIAVIGGLQQITLPLYDMTTDPHRPLWHQDKDHIPNDDLNYINIKVPFWHDAVKIPLPADIGIYNHQFVTSDSLLVSPSISPYVGEKVFIVGYPYGYSSTGKEQPTPVVLTRFIASSQLHGRTREMLLESPGAPGMSGGPVFVLREENLKLMGLYTGLIFPDYYAATNDRMASLGTCVDMTMCWQLIPLSDKYL